MDPRLLPAVQKAYDLNLWLLPRVERFPRNYKFTLGDRLQAAALDLSLALVEAAHAKSKQRPLYRANRLLDQLRILLRLARDVELLSLRQHEYVSGLNEELGRMVGGWIRWVGGAATAPFLGYIVWPDRIRVRGETVRRFRRRHRKTALVDPVRAQSSLSAWNGHVQLAGTWRRKGRL